MELGWDPRAVYRRFNIDKYPARDECREKFLPAPRREHTVGYSQYKPVELAKSLERNQFDAVLALGLSRIGKRIGNGR